MKSKRLSYCIGVVIFLNFYSFAYAADRKEDMAKYINSINPILINVQVSSRNANQNLVSLQTVAKQMNGYIKDAKAIKVPVFMARQHKMILLGLSKIKSGFYVLAAGDKKSSVPLVRRGVMLLKTAGLEIKSMAEKEGLVKEKLRAHLGAEYLDIEHLGARQGSRLEGK